MRRLKCIIAYDGTDFAGYQVQPNARTVQGVLEKALMKLHKGEPIRIYASGRTDGKVHAVGQVIHFDSPLKLTCEQWIKALNSLISDDITIKHAEYVDSSFHARYSAKSKEYRYRILRKKEKDPFLRNYTYHFPYPLDLDAMRQAIAYFIGTHDFTSFCSAKTDIEDRIRTIEEFEFFEENEELIFRIKGNGFLYNMVRIIIGTVLEVGVGKRDPGEIPKILAGRKRELAGKTVPGHGLYLWKVEYDEGVRKIQKK